jgi:phage-related protein
MADEEWSVVFYIEDDGGSPVREFLAALDRKTRARFDSSIEQLQVRNLQASEPLVRHLEGKLWELRRESDTNIYRLFYAFVSRRRILFLHGFHKKTQTTPRHEITLAEQRPDHFLKRERGEE